MTVEKTEHSGRSEHAQSKIARYTLSDLESVHAREGVRPISRLQVSFLDFPGRYSATLFLQGCNLRCPYCFNKEFLEAGDGEVSGFTALTYINSLRMIIPEIGVVFSGGEPTFNPYFEDLLHTFRSFPLGIHTNGLLLPEKMVFESVVLSLKHPDHYPKGAVHRLKKAVNFYRDARHKELRIVDCGPEYLEVVKGEILGAILDEAKDWHLEIIPQQGGIL